MTPALAHIDTWIFDLDNTLYPASTDLFGLIDVRMGQFIQNLLGVDPIEARRIQKSYFFQHGTTLSGLMQMHGVDPHDFLAFVHDIEMDVLTEDVRLIRSVAELPGRKLVFTNGDGAYARRVLGRLGLSEAFEAIHDIHACAYQPKPLPESYRSIIDALGIEPTTSLFVDDLARNLKPAKDLGMKTVWINNGSERGSTDAQPDFIDYETNDLAEWLESIVGVNAE